MVFSSAYFLLLFLPLTLLLYFIVPKRFRNLVLLVASLYFYAYGEEILVLIMVFSTLLDYKCGLLIEQGKRKLGLRISIVANLLTLGFFKYFNFGVENAYAILDTLSINSESIRGIPEIALPLGISFYIFQTMSYTIDVYYGRVKANKNILEFATYVTMFPQLVAGPIVRYADIQKQILDRTVTLLDFTKGLERFILGLGKKILIANTFASIADNIFVQNGEGLSTYSAWLGVIAYSFQIYYDFSGYSDMAIGLGRMFGFTFLENFNYPYISKSIQEFWRRWHISLSTWFKDYLYIPLGGNKKGITRTYLNLIIVFLITGLWHGASWNFVIWGIYHGCFIILEKLFLGPILKKSGVLQNLYVLGVVTIGWVFFRIEEFPNSIYYLKTLIIPTSGNPSVNDFITYFNSGKELAITLVVAIAFSMPLYPYLEKKLTNPTFLIFRYIGVICLLLICITYIAAGSYNPFIYFRF